MAKRRMSISRRVAKAIVVQRTQRERERRKNVRRQKKAKPKIAPEVLKTLERKESVETTMFLPRPETVRRINVRNIRRASETARRLAFAVRRAVRSNIDTQDSGSWPPLVCRTGRALVGRKKDWKVQKTPKGYRVEPEPFWWDVHMNGPTIIRPRYAKVLRFWCPEKLRKEKRQMRSAKVRKKAERTGKLPTATGWVFAKKVTIPRRDPRPSKEQILKELR